MDNQELIFNEYKLYCEQKENFIDRNFRTNRFYMVSIIVVLLAMIYTNNVIFIHKISATLIFSLFGIFTSALWWMNVDSYNTLIKIKFSKVIEVLEEKLPVKPYTKEFEGIKEFKSKNVFMFSDIQKIVSMVAALFFFAVFTSEITPFLVKVAHKILARI